VLEDSERTELVQVLRGQPVLAQALKQALVGIQDATLLQCLQSFLFDTFLLCLFDFLEKSLLSLLLELSLEELVLALFYFDLLGGHVSHFSGVVGCSILRWFWRAEGKQISYSLL